MAARTLLLETESDYDVIAQLYHQYWSNHYHPWAVEVLDRTLLQRLTPGARILDVCCGTGVIARELTARGYAVTGIDQSAGMLAWARINAPEAVFIQSDARTWKPRRRFDAAVSTFDSLNHILSERDLVQVFRNVHQALRPGAGFVFDMNMEQAYEEAWHQTCSLVDDDCAFFVRGEYKSEERLGRTDVTVFSRNGSWTRGDTSLWQRFYPREQVMGLLGDTGFTARCLDVVQDLGIEGPFGVGRAVFEAVRE